MLCFFSFFSNNMLWYFWGFNYSKMANQGPRTYSNTFWMILGTSKFRSKSGPADLPIITKILQRIQKHMGTSWNIFLCKPGNQTKSFFPEISESLKHRCCSFLFICYRKSSISMLYHILWRWGSGNDNIFIKKHVQKLGYDFHIYQKHEMEIW